MEDNSQLVKRLDDLEKVVYTHKHLVSDKTQSLPSTTVQVYGGRVLAAATGTLPATWLVSKNATPVYTITHNLGTTAYSVVVLATGANLPIILMGYNANTFTAEFDNASGTAFATDWNFILRVIT